MKKTIKRLEKIIFPKLLKFVFLSEPVFEINDQKRKIFDAEFNRVSNPKTAGKLITFDIPYPKYEFFSYLVREKNILIHGSNSPDIKRLEPKQQNDWNGRPVKAVFASRDGLWPLFFATVKHEGYRGSFRNGCFVINQNHCEKRFYFFSLNRDYREKYPWQDGTVYLLPGGQFSRLSDGVVRFDEWASFLPVIPLAKIKVSPMDFPFLNKVSWHDEDEKMIKTWLLYKLRLNMNF